MVSNTLERICLMLHVSFILRLVNPPGFEPGYGKVRASCSAVELQAQKKDQLDFSEEVREGGRLTFSVKRAIIYSPREDGGDMDERRETRLCSYICSKALRRD